VVWEGVRREAPSYPDPVASAKGAPPPVDHRQEHRTPAGVPERLRDPCRGRTVVSFLFPVAARIRACHRL